MGLASEQRMKALDIKKREVAEITRICAVDSLDPDSINPYLISVDSAEISERQKIGRLLLRPNVSIKGLMENDANLQTTLGSLAETSIEQAEIQLKYSRYLEKEEEMALRMSQLENLLIPGHINYDQIPALSNEALQKFKKIQPQTLGQASRISGVNPSDVQILMVYMGR
jgi:tRNA uridine 5-carboxymethylaminomethyl modification enzyme